jgi:molybdopterin synthase catalytic subunit/molybdopterin converting factor small subunit
MQVHILPFGILKSWLEAGKVDLPDGATVARLLQSLSANGSRVPANVWSSIAVSVNAEYVQAGQILREGDEVGLLPPVSGGSPSPTTPFDPYPEADSPIRVYLTHESIEADNLVYSAKRGEDGAVVVFEGIVRNNSRGRQTLHLDYESYEDMALKQMKALAADALLRYGVRHVTIVHRLGRMVVGETSVLIIVASAHRAQAYEASRFLIDTLKRTVPIWKKETFVDGAVWSDGEPFPAGIAIAPEAPSAS